MVLKDDIAYFNNLLKTSKKLGFRVSSDLGSFTSQVILYFVTLREWEGEGRAYISSYVKAALSILYR